jgi:hypothetical protein
MLLIVASNKSFLAKQLRAADEARALKGELEVLQERLGRAQAAKRVNRTLVNQLERDIETARLREQLVLANYVIRNLVFEGRRLLGSGSTSPYYERLAQMFEETLDQCDGILHCQICGEAGDASEMTVCDGGGTTEEHIACCYCHENGYREEHRLLAQGDICASCVCELQKMAIEEKAMLGAGQIH